VAWFLVATGFKMCRLVVDARILATNKELIRPLSMGGIQQSTQTALGSMLYVCIDTTTITTVVNCSYE
jgi:hypothetical protein